MLLNDLRLGTAGVKGLSSQVFVVTQLQEIPCSTDNPLVLDNFIGLTTLQIRMFLLDLSVAQFFKKAGDEGFTQESGPQ